MHTCACIISKWLPRTTKNNYFCQQYNRYVIASDDTIRVKRVQSVKSLWLTTVGRYYLNWYAGRGTPRRVAILPYTYRPFCFPSSITTPRRDAENRSTCTCICVNECIPHASDARVSLNSHTHRIRTYRTRQNNSEIFCETINLCCNFLIHGEKWCINSVKYNWRQFC